MNYQLEGYDNVRYERYDGLYDGFSLDHKVMEAFRRFSWEYEYIWVCRDGLIVDGNVVQEEVFSGMDEGADFIVVNAPWRCEKEMGNRHYRECTQFFQEQCMQMTVLGATILKSTIIQKILKDIPLENGRNYSLWQPMAYFEYIADHDFYAVSVEANIWYYNTASASKSHWKSKTMRQWCKEWYSVVSNLPECYNPYKEEVLNIHMSDFHPFRTDELLRTRADGGLTFSEVCENKGRLHAVCNTPIWIFYLVSLLPPGVAKKLALHFDGKLIKTLKVIRMIISGRIPGEAEIEG